MVKAIHKEEVFRSLSLDLAIFLEVEKKRDLPQPDSPKYKKIAIDWRH